MGGFLGNFQSILFGNVNFNPLPVQWRPPQWQGPQLTSLTVTQPSTPSASVTTSSPGTGVGSPVTVPPLTTTQPGTRGVSTTYFFDAVLRLEHQHSARITEHPIQAGASIADHAYNLPSTVILEIGMSDVMDRYQPGQYTGSASKSVSAFQVFKKLKEGRLPMTLNTRLNRYQNMLITDIRATDDLRAYHGLKALIVLRQIIVGTLAINVDSARADQTDSSMQGTKTGAAPDADTLNRLKTSFGNLFSK